MEAEKGKSSRSVIIVVLLVVAAAAVYFAVSQAQKPPAKPDVQVASGGPAGPPPYIDPELGSKGVPAQGDPDFKVDVRLEQAKGRNTFHFTITEGHGWAANGIYITLAHRDLPINYDIRDADPNRTLEILCDKAPLRFGQPLEHRTTVTALDFPELTDFGTSENWSATVTNYSDLTAPK
jgi:hypothetical protein